METLTTRFAPSPTGLLHLGHVFAAGTAWRHARMANGRFLVRMEDIDPVRCRPAFAAAILDDLDWLGFRHDGEVRLQSAHLPDYAAVLDRLAARGLSYPCFCSRADVARAAAAAHGPEGLVYPGTCRTLGPEARARRIGAGVPYAIRLDMEAAARLAGPLAFVEDGRPIACDPVRFGDIVLARRDSPVSYHLCVTHDDALQGVTLVTRGEDLRDATGIHCLLQHLLGWPAPRYAHHRLLTDAAGRRLAKRDAAATVRAMRAAGRSPGQVRAAAGLLV